MDYRKLGSTIYIRKHMGTVLLCFQLTQKDRPHVFLADLAMYKLKRSGKQGYRFSDDETT